MYGIFVRDNLNKIISNVALNVGTIKNRNIIVPRHTIALFETGVYMDVIIYQKISTFLNSTITKLHEL